MSAKRDRQILATLECEAGQYTAHVGVFHKASHSFIVHRNPRLRATCSGTVKACGYSVQIVHMHLILHGQISIFLCK
jgi:hypothetical protein